MFDVLHLQIHGGGKTEMAILLPDAGEDDVPLNSLIHVDLLTREQLSS